jgi:hypothetical protein
MNPIHRTMSLNLNGLYGEDANTWEKRGPLVLKVINRYKPDLIGLQEASKVNLETLIQGLEDYKLVQGNVDRLRLPLHIPREGGENVQDFEGLHFFSVTSTKWVAGRA